MSAVEAFLDALGTTTPEALERLHTPVTLMIGPQAARAFEGQVALLTSARLLTRLYNRALLLAPDAPLLLPVPCEALSDGAVQWADGRPILCLDPEGQVLAIGDVPAAPSATYMAASGWRARLSSTAPVALPS